MVEFVRRPSLEQVIRELVVQRGCLAEELRLLSLPRQEVLRDAGGGSSGSGRRGSPAPWSPAAAELLDAMFRGALRFHEQGRPLLGWSPFTVSRPMDLPRPTPAGDSTWCPYPRPTPVAVSPRLLSRDVAGRCALVALPGLVRGLADAHHPWGERISSQGAVRDGVIEEKVRSWYRQARELTGRELPLERLPSIPNPDHPSHGGRRRIGPVCRSCQHRSCLRIASGRHRTLHWPCPVCGADSLRRDPVTDEVICLKPSCLDPVTGERVSYQLAQFADPSDDPWDDMDPVDVDIELAVVVDEGR